MHKIDLNCDMGEIREAIDNGSQEALMPFLTSVNIACGGHAGDDDMMRITIAQARRHHLALGAHPGYPDRVNFGRLPLDMPLEAVADTVFEQVTAFARIALETGAQIRHVKPHGALYNSAARDPALARAIADGVARWSKHAALMGLAGSLMLDIFRDAGFNVLAEAFADRRYEPDGSLRSRNFPDSLITDPEQSARQVVEILQGHVTAIDGSTIEIHAQTICIHGDNPNAAAIARRISGV
jgi:5-oxoprolinase (ATP-hydrolysing) subunit A